VLDQIEDKLELSFRELGRQNLKNISKPIGEPAELSHAPRLSTDDLSTLRRAALQGIGAVLIPHLLVANDLASGALVRLLPSLVHAVFPSRRGMIPAVRARASRGAETVRLLPS
jgi:DNA-binding transcriptional LysR family regulator